MIAYRNHNCNCISCFRHRGGILAEYYHNEIEINVTNANENITGTYYGDWGMQVKILETGEVYSDGEFVANLLYQGVVTEDTANFTGAVTVCENRAQINSTCTYMKFDYDYFAWDNETDSGIINFTSDADRYGIVNPIYPHQYTVIDDEERDNCCVDTCVEIW